MSHSIRERWFYTSNCWSKNDTPVHDSNRTILLHECTALQHRKIVCHWMHISCGLSSTFEKVGILHFGLSFWKANKTHKTISYRRSKNKMWISHKLYKKKYKENNLPVLPFCLYFRSFFVVSRIFQCRRERKNES